ncbi:hypothetical protein [Natrinema versiforme]|uniref:Uncharacterized protein n=1 Tax=Natrinema versiforme JCM 10478 TaxID=1227496 RepID=L9Y7K3_9EURY|nr:hypothetical protein [Natrinema versiforme]ELY68918.1 hypothetical protein C489_06113 [Natrinema versiforme JCM 10478]
MTETIELELYGNVEAVETKTGDGIPRVVPQTVTLPAPSAGDHVVVLRTDPDVTFIHVLPPESDGLEGFDSDLATTTTVDGEPRSECWVSAPALENAAQLSIDTHDRAGDLETVDIDVDYRGWTARLARRVREFKHKRRANKALARR